MATSNKRNEPVTSSRYAKYRKWSTSRLFSPSPLHFLDTSLWNSQRDHRSKISENIISFDSLEPCPKVFCLDLCKFSGTESSHFIVKKYPRASNEGTFLYLMTRTSLRYLLGFWNTAIRWNQSCGVILLLHIVPEWNKDRIGLNQKLFTSWSFQLHSLRKR